MRKVLIFGAILAVAVFFAYTQWQNNPFTPRNNTPQEKLVELDPTSPADRALEAYLEAVQSAGRFTPEWEVTPDNPKTPDEVAQHSKNVYKHFAKLLGRFDGRIKYLADAPVQLIKALRGHLAAAHQFEKVVRDKFPAEIKEDRLCLHLLHPLVSLASSLFPGDPGPLLLVDTATGKPDVMKKTERDREILYRLRWQHEPFDVFESLILVQEDGDWKMLTPAKIVYAYNNIAPDPNTGKGKNCSLVREDKDWTADDYRESNTEATKQIQALQTVLEELTKQVSAGKITMYGQLKEYEKRMPADLK
jgi:hypothetical protein